MSVGFAESLVLHNVLGNLIFPQETIPGFILASTRAEGVR